MKAIILSAGYGSRLGELTKDKPKPMLDVGGKPVIECILERLAIHGITDVIVNIHYLPELLPEYLQERALYYYEPRLLGHKKTILALKPWLKDADFMVINGDTVTDLNYTWMINEHKPQTITAYMDEWRCAGTWIYPKEYFDNPNLPVYPYREHGSTWFDIGTKERLEEARKYYA